MSRTLENLRMHIQDAEPPKEDPRLTRARANAAKASGGDNGSPDVQNSLTTAMFAQASGNRTQTTTQRLKQGTPNGLTKSQFGRFTKA